MVEYMIPFLGTHWNVIYIPSSLMKSISFTFPIVQLVGFDLLRSDLGGTTV